MLLRRRAAAAALLAATALLAGACGGEAEPGPRGVPGRVDRAVLADLAAEVEARDSSCFAVAQAGELAGEWYWGDGGRDTPQEVFSVTKSVTSTLVGLAQADGLLSVDQPAADFIPSWRGTDSATVTVRDLLANVSGRTFDAATDVGDLVAAPDRTAYAVAAGQEDPPGTVWEYNNTAIQTLDAVLVAATGTDTATYARERLFAPLGMADSALTSDDSGASTNVFFGMRSTCRDLLRFGQLFAQGGKWDGEQLLPRAWVEAAVGDSSQQLNPSYGLLWWLNRDGREAPGAPADLFAAVGLSGQVVLVDPASQVVVVRLAPLQDEDYGFADAARVVTDALSRAR